MIRKFTVPLLALAFLAAPAFTPAGLSDAVQAATTVHGTKSNADGKVRGGKRTVKGSKSNNLKATTVSGSKSNQDGKVRGGKKPSRVAKRK